MNVLTALLSAIKDASPVLSIGLTIASLVSLVAPEWLMGYLGLADLRGQYRHIVGGTFLLSLSLCLAHACTPVFKDFWKQHKRNQAYRLGKARLQEEKSEKDAELRKKLVGLTPDEKQLVKRYMETEATSLMMRLGDPIGSVLVHKRIIFLASNMKTIEGKYPYGLDDAVRTILKAEPRLLDTIEAGDLGSKRP